MKKPIQDTLWSCTYFMTAIYMFANNYFYIGIFMLVLSMIRDLKTIDLGNDDAKKSADDDTKKENDSK